MTAQPPPSPSRKDAFSQLSSTTPPMPMSSPATRQTVKRSLSQNQPTMAPKIGVVAFRIDEKPAVSDNAAKPNITNGIAELNRPATNSLPLFSVAWRTSLEPPLRAQAIGSSTAAPIAHLTIISGVGPNSGAATRMNRNDAPQTAASSRNSAWLRRFMRARP